MGATREEILADYLLSNVAMHGDFIATGTATGSSTAAVYDTVMLRTLDVIDAKYGGARAYLRSIGLSEAQLDGLVSILRHGPTPPADGARPVMRL